MVTESEIDTNRPYPPPSNVITVLQRLRSRNLPTTIDEEYLRDAGIPEGTIGRTIFALKFLALISPIKEISEPTKAIHTSTDEEYRSILAGLIKEAYKEVFNVTDPSQDTQDKILNVFRRYTPASQRERMVIFFLGMCREAGIPTLDVPKARSMSNKPARQTINPARSASRPQQRSQQGRAEVTSNSTLAPALDGLIKSLPEPGTPMSEAKRKQWLAMAEAILKFTYPDEPQKIAEALQTNEEVKREATTTGQ